MMYSLRCFSVSFSNIISEHGQSFLVLSVRFTSLGASSGDSAQDGECSGTKWVDHRRVYNRTPSILCPMNSPSPARSITFHLRTTDL